MSERLPGFEDYIPSRLEWLALFLNSYVQYLDLSITKGMNINRYYMPKKDGKTLLLWVSYPKDTDSDEIEDIIETLVNHTKNITDLYNWNSWVEIEVVRRPQE